MPADAPAPAPSAEVRRFQDHEAVAGFHAQIASHERAIAKMERDIVKRKEAVAFWREQIDAAQRWRAAEGGGGVTA